MRFDLTEPCLHCPFRPDATAIRFTGVERAEEIEEGAYRHGFPCHRSAVNTENEHDDGGYEFRANGKTQHCMGALMMFLRDGYSSTPGTGNDEDLFERIERRANWSAPHFQCVADFLAANDGRKE